MPSTHCEDCASYQPKTPRVGYCPRHKCHVAHLYGHRCPHFEHKASVAADFREPSGELRADADAPQDEDALQAAAEKLLTERGYVRMTPLYYTAVSNGFSIRGWFAHWHGKGGTQGQPQVSDLLILNADMRRCRMVELKPPGKVRWQPGQREAVESGAWTLAQGLVDLARIVDEFEAEQYRKDACNE